MMRTPVALYPYNNEMLPLLKHFSALNGDYDIVKLLAPEGWCITGKDAGYVANQPDTGFTVESELDEHNPLWQVLLIVEPMLGLHGLLLDETVTYIKRTLTVNKRVTVVCEKNENIPEEITNIVESNPSHINIISAKRYSPKMQQSSGTGKIEKLNTPVVLVGGLVDEADTFNVLISLAEKMRGMGKNVLVLTKHPAGASLGFRLVYNEVLKNGKYTESEKITELNHMIKSVEEEDLPDVILIEAPDAIMKYSDDIPNGHGIWTYMLLQAVKPDFLVCCVHCQMLHEQFINALSTDFKTRFGAVIGAVCASNIIIDGMDSLQKTKISYSYTTQDDVNKRIQAMNGNDIPVFSIVDKDMGTLSRLIIEKLYKIL